MLSQSRRSCPGYGNRAHSHSGRSVGAGKYVRSSFTQWALNRSWEVCEELIHTVLHSE